MSEKTNKKEMKRQRIALLAKAKEASKKKKYLHQSPTDSESERNEEDTPLEGNEQNEPRGDFNSHEQNEQNDLLDLIDKHQDQVDYENYEEESPLPPHELTPQKEASVIVSNMKPLAPITLLGDKTEKALKNFWDAATASGMSMHFSLHEQLVSVLGQVAAVIYNGWDQTQH